MKQKEKRAREKKKGIKRRKGKREKGKNDGEKEESEGERDRLKENEDCFYVMHLEGDAYVDAAHMGNEARFVNHRYSRPLSLPSHG